MATSMEGSYVVPADLVTVWNGLNDPDILKRCIGGVQTLERLDPTHFAVLARIRLGPLGASFKVQIELHDVQAPNGCRIVGEGEGGIAGFAKGFADVRLTAVPDGTAVTYAVEANIGGRLAKLGGRLIDGIADRLAVRFFTAFTAAVATPQAAE